ncbi:hypothetical protein WICMUC_001528 [Wickerhamomyces mucosus]|uniref:Cyclin-like domain-containing protein n=1 Tax=Wickerhamomyces mucosus TaxID=1378264 RepID=A0A9P8TGZ7_9ASCO|nr:hypothetical protein WICMUC_001528 [Wickerhamomyces mucosus]
MLNSLVELNDSYTENQESQGLSPSNLTRFHSRTPPGISIYNYIARLSRYSSLENAVLLATVYYIDLLTKAYPNFTLNSLTVHRFLLTATTVGSKGLCDSFCTNSHYAKVGGVQVNELDILEREFLMKVNYRILPRDNTQRFNTERRETAPSNIEYRSFHNSNNDNTENVFQERKNSFSNFEEFKSKKLDKQININHQNQIPIFLKDGFDVLDMYYIKMTQLVGKETSLDDKEIQPSILYEIDSHNTLLPPHFKPASTNTKPDTLSNERFNILMRNLNIELNSWQQQQQSHLSTLPLQSNTPSHYKQSRISKIPNQDPQVLDPLSAPPNGIVNSQTETFVDPIPAKTPLKRPIRTEYYDDNKGQTHSLNTNLSASSANGSSSNGSSNGSFKNGLGQFKEREIKQQQEQGKDDGDDEDEKVVSGDRKRITSR